ncbi:hypothetical protein B7494_g3105 [Chlorociboria aeruginascens]|nr:hypothetical protein B7494_g3105 [Chlorociboria aeruginascens]
MALDAQSNYNIEMPQLKLPLRQAEPMGSSLLRQDPPLRNPPTKEILLPIEIISHILYYVPRRSQSTIWACTLVSRAWYAASVPLLYERPYLGGGNFNQFVNTVCPSKNAHIRQSALAVLALHLAGGVDDSFLKRHLINAPPSLERLSIQSCPQVHSFALLDILEILGSQLRHLTIRHPMAQLCTGIFDYILTSCVSLEALRVSADYISNNLFSVACIPTGHPLRILDLDCSTTAGAEVDISPGEIYLAVEEGRLSDLRSVRVSARLAWAATERTRQDASDLAEILEEKEDENPLGIPTGVWTMSDSHIMTKPNRNNAGKAAMYSSPIVALAATVSTAGPLPVTASGATRLTANPLTGTVSQHNALPFQPSANGSLDELLQKNNTKVPTSLVQKPS